MRIGTHCGDKVEDGMVATVFCDLELLPDRLSFLPFLLRFTLRATGPNQKYSKRTDKNVVMESNLRTMVLV